MSTTNFRIRANRTTGELEIEGPIEAVSDWWEKIWPQMPLGTIPPITALAPKQPGALVTQGQSGNVPDLFGEYFTTFRSDLTDIDRILIAGAFAQFKDSERTFTTKVANQLLLDQNIKVGNASEAVRRLVQTKKAFVVGDGKFRVSASGMDHLKSLSANA